METFEHIACVIDLIFIVVEGIFLWVQFKQNNKMQKEIHTMLKDLTQINEKHNAELPH